MLYVLNVNVLIIKNQFEIFYKLYIILLRFYTRNSFQKLILSMDHNGDLRLGAFILIIVK